MELQTSFCAVCGLVAYRHIFKQLLCRKHPSVWRTLRSWRIKCEVTSPPLHQQVATASSSATAVAASSNFYSLLKCIDNMITSRIRTELSQRILQLVINQRGRRPFRNGHGSRSRSRSRTPGVCWYHNSFWDKRSRNRYINISENYWKTYRNTEIYSPRSLATKCVSPLLRTESSNFST